LVSAPRWKSEPGSSGDCCRAIFRGNLKPTLDGERLEPDRGRFDRIGAKAIGIFWQAAPDPGRLFRGDVGWSSPAGRSAHFTERRIGHAQQFGVGIDRRARQRDRRWQPPPHAAIATGIISKSASWAYEEKPVHPPGGERFSMSGPRRRIAKREWIRDMRSTSARPFRGRCTTTPISLDFCWTKS